MSMWEPFTERARRVVVLAQEEAQRLGCNYMGTEHLLLGLMSEGENLACQVLQTFGFTLVAGRAEVEAIIGRNGRTSLQLTEMTFTPRAKRIIELAYDEARTLNHNYIGTEHILLGLILEGEGVSSRVLTNFGIDSNKLYNALLQTMSEKLPKTRIVTKMTPVKIPEGEEASLTEHKVVVDSLIKGLQKHPNTSQEKFTALVKLAEAKALLEKAAETDESYG